MQCNYKTVKYKNKRFTVVGFVNLPCLQFYNVDGKTIIKIKQNKK